jgi:hypothetical protein
VRERLVIATTDLVDPDGLAAVILARPDMVITEGRPVVDADHLDRYEHNKAYYQRDLSNERHGHNTKRFAADLAAVGLGHIAVFRGPELGEWDDPSETFTYDGLVLPKTKLTTTIDHRYHYDDRKHTFDASAERAPVGDFRSALDRIFATDQELDFLLFGPATEAALITRLMKQRKVDHRLGALAAQGDFFGTGEGGGTLAFGKPFNYKCDVAAGNYLIREYPGPFFAARSRFTRHRTVSYHHDSDAYRYTPGIPEEAYLAALSDLQIKTKLEQLLGPGVPDILVQRYVTHITESSAGLRQRARDEGQPHSYPLTVSVDDAHLSILLDQWRKGRGPGQPYTWESVDIPGAAGERYDVTDINPEIFKQFARSAMCGLRMNN